jgi:hypothetical protein
MVDIFRSQIRKNNSEARVMRHRGILRDRNGCRAFAARVKCKQEVFSGKHVLASTIVQIQRLAFPEILVEIRCKLMQVEECYSCVPIQRFSNIEI